MRAFASQAGLAALAALTWINPSAQRPALVSTCHFRELPTVLYRRFAYSLAVLLALTLAGTLGYAWLEGWGFVDGLYMTVITVGTVGYGEVRPLSTGGRV